MSYKVPKAHFTKITNKAIRNNDMSDTAFRVYCYIASTNQDKFNISLRGLARNLNKSTATITKSIKELEELGYLTRERISNNETVYHLFSTPKLLD